MRKIDRQKEREDTYREQVLPDWSVHMMGRVGQEDAMGQEMRMIDRQKEREEETYRDQRNEKDRQKERDGETYRDQRNEKDRQLERERRRDIERLEK